MYDMSFWHSVFDTLQARLHLHDRRDHATKFTRYDTLPGYNLVIVQKLHQYGYDELFHCKNSKRHDFSFPWGWDNDLARARQGLHASIKDNCLVSNPKSICKN